MVIDLPSMLQRINNGGIDQLPPQLWPIKGNDRNPSTFRELENLSYKFGCLSQLEWYEFYLEVERLRTTAQILLRAPAAVSRVLERSTR